MSQTKPNLEILQNSNTPPDESLFQEKAIPTIENLENLFQPPTTLAPETREMLIKATDEVVGIIKATIATTNRTLQYDKLDETIRKEFEEGIELGIEALRFLNDFCANLHQENFPVDNVTLEISSNTSDEVRLMFRSSDSDVHLGKIGKDTVTGAEIIIRTGESNEVIGDIPMQLNFRFITGHNTELTSLRLDMHRKRDNIVAMDAEIGNLRTQRLHTSVDSLNVGDSEANFRAFQHVFLINFVEKVLAEDITEGRIEFNQNISVVDNKHQAGVKRLMKMYRNARSHMPDNSHVHNNKEVVEDIIPVEQEKHPLLDALNDAISENVELSDVLTVAFNKVLAPEIPIEGSADANKVISEWILGVEQPDDERIMMAIEELKHFENVQSVIPLERENNTPFESDMEKLTYFIIENGSEEDLETLEKLYSIRRLLQLLS